MKTTIILATLALAPALLAAEPNPSSEAPVQVSTNAPAVAEGIADQAALVQQIGEQAARGFDPEAHAHALRVQIEALVGKPIKQDATLAEAGSATSAHPGGAVTTAQSPVAAQAPTPASPGTTAREAAIRDAIAKLRSALDELENRVTSTRTSR